MITSYHQLNNTPNKIKEVLYDSFGPEISSIEFESESKEYDACQFLLNDSQIIYRKAKITPKKSGQFVTFWRRNKEGITAPFHENDSFDYYIINVKKENRLGQFVFPKSVLIEKGIVATDKKDGKRGFRVYPIWDDVNNKQAQKSQEWQLKHFYEPNEKANLLKFFALSGN